MMTEKISRERKRSITTLRFGRKGLYYTYF